MIPNSPVRADAAVIALVGVAHATSHLFHLLLPPLFPLLMPDFGFGYTEAGFLMTVFFTISGVGQAFAGIVVDRYGARRVLMAGVSLLAASGLALSAAANYSMLLLAVALAGIGNSVFHPADFSLLNKKVSPARLGYAFSVHGLSGNLGWAIGAAISGMALAWAGWRGAGIAAALVALCSVAALQMAKPLLDDDVARVGAGGTAAGATFGFLGAPAIWLAFMFFLLITAAFGGLQSFSAPVLGGIYGLSPATAVAALTGYLLGSAAGMVIGGFVAVRVQAHDRTVGGALIAAAVFAAVLASGLPAAWSVIPLMAGIGIGVGLAGPSRDLLVRRVATDSLAGGNASPAFGRVYGFVYSGLDVGLALGPLAFGMLLDAGGRDGVLPGVALLQVLAVLTVLAMGRRVGRPALRSG
ncbi:MFS transporter [Sulfuritalea hydrogenivorans]|uniref:Major facilitator transporter n=1 Tax=Sulfuritalea hydrogenivorans sk43H TaxID=1223802 RepID=W0SH23_9PROT|nr:MFS transporter [Sulfuritalea hydrogenivorans]MDK9712950.1 MFS transporter [Sulfuritalea sp.]BAO30257.1 major facilitator transporter [Sulfuritalea hydrogenivorans sk43H]